MQTISEELPLRIAIPYYASLLMPRRGVSRIYFIVRVNLVKRQVLRVDIQVWPNDAEGSLADWLRGQGVSGLLCNDNCAYFRETLTAAGIWMSCRPQENLGDMLRDWLGGNAEKSEESWPGAFGPRSFATGASGRWRRDGSCEDRNFSTRVNPFE